LSIILHVILHFIFIAYPIKYCNHLIIIKINHNQCPGLVSLKRCRLKRKTVIRYTVQVIVLTTVAMNGNNRLQCCLILRIVQ